MNNLLTKERAKKSVETKKKKILWVDHESHMHTVNCSFLDILGYEVCFARNGLEAMEKARNNNPDLILLDLMIPGVNGFQICGIFKHDNRFWQIPVIIISALFSEEDQLKAKSVGADAYITKPFEIQTLLSKVNMLTNGKIVEFKPESIKIGSVRVEKRF